MDTKNEIYYLKTVLGFGKHQGKTVEQVIADDPTYIYWMFDSKFNLSKEVRAASNKRTQERRVEKGLPPMPNKVTRIVKGGTVIVGQGELGTKMALKHLERHLNNRGFEKHGIMDDLENEWSEEEEDF